MVSVDDAYNQEYVVVTKKKKKGFLDTLNDMAKKVMPGSQQMMFKNSPLLNALGSPSAGSPLPGGLSHPIAGNIPPQVVQQQLNQWQQQQIEEEKRQTKIRRYLDLKKKHYPYKYQGALIAIECTLLEVTQAVREDAEKLVDEDQQNLLKMLELLAEAKELSTKSVWARKGDMQIPEEVVEELKTLKNEIRDHNIYEPPRPTFREYMEWKNQMAVQGGYQFLSTNSNYPYNYLQQSGGATISYMPGTSFNISGSK